MLEACTSTMLHSNCPTTTVNRGWNGATQASDILYRAATAKGIRTTGYIFCSRQGICKFR